METLLLPFSPRFIVLTICAVVTALEGGTLDASRFRSYRKLQRELRAIEVKADVRLQIEERRKWKLIHKTVKQHMQVKRRWD